LHIRLVHDYKVCWISILSIGIEDKVLIKSQLNAISIGGNTILIT